MGATAVAPAVLLVLLVSGWTAALLSMGRSALPRRRAGADDDASDRAGRGGEQPAAVGTP